MTTPEPPAATQPRAIAPAPAGPGDAKRCTMFGWRHRQLRTAAALCALAAPLAAPSPADADDPDNCLLCHRYRGLGRIETDSDRVHLYFTDPDYSQHRLGPHARLACTDCHERAEVGVIPHQPVTRVDCARQCHLSDATGLQRLFSHENVASMLQRSVHREQTLVDLQTANGPLLGEGQSVCLYCHDEPVFRDPARVMPAFSELAGRVFDRCDVCHSAVVPVDIEYYVRHVASRFQPARPTLAIAQVCAVCHSDPRVCRDHEMPDSVASFVRSFHGKAALLGDETTANCLSCHVAAGENAHLMLGRENPAASIHETRIADSCRSTACHPGAEKSIAEAAVHLDLPTAHGTFEFALAGLFILLTILTFGPSAVLVMLDLVQVLVGRKHAKDEHMEALADSILRHPLGPALLTRFTVQQRLEHWILVALFVLLVVTGFPLKFADETWARIIVRSFGGLQITRTLHHWAGVALILGFLWHLYGVLVDVLRKTRSRRAQGDSGSLRKTWVQMPMWITWGDVKKTFDLLAYLLFLRKNRPGFGRFSPTEKFEYLGVFWGTLLLGITGALLWGEQLSSRFLGGRAFNIASIAHTYEAFLAVIHVGILHIYNVILAPRVFPLSTATIDGRTPMAKLAEEHGELIVEAAAELGLPLEEHTP